MVHKQAPAAANVAVAGVAARVGRNRMKWAGQPASASARQGGAVLRSLPPAVHQLFSIVPVAAFLSAPPHEMFMTASTSSPCSTAWHSMSQHSAAWLSGLHCPEARARRGPATLLQGCQAPYPLKRHTLHPTLHAAARTTAPSAAPSTQHRPPTHPPHHRSTAPTSSIRLILQSDCG